MSEAKQQELKREAETKLATLREQMTQASDRRKAQVEERIVAVTADYEARNTRLEQARQLVREALAI